MIVKSVIAIGISEGQPPMALLDAVSTKRYRDLSRAGYPITAGIGFAAIVAAAYRRHNGSGFLPQPERVT
jgi:hypothetical protein